MSVSLEYLTQCAAETGYRVEPLEKVVRLGNLAGDIARHPLLGPVLALKGGTALNLCYGPPKRLSVDLDYNYVGEIERRKMLDRVDLPHQVVTRGEPPQETIQARHPGAQVNVNRHTIPLVRPLCRSPAQRAAAPDQAVPGRGITPGGHNNRTWYFQRQAGRTSATRYRLLFTIYWQ